MLVASGTGGPEHCIRVWSVPGGRSLHTLHGHTKWLWSVAFDPSGTHLVSGSEDQNFRVWDLSSRMPAEVISTTSPITHVAFTPDGHSILAIAMRRSDKDILVLDSVTKQSVGRLSTNTPEINPAPRSFGLSWDDFNRTCRYRPRTCDSGGPNRRLKRILPVLHGGDDLDCLRSVRMTAARL